MDNGALTQTIEQTKQGVDAAVKKMDERSKHLDDNVALVGEALKDYEQVKDMVEQIKADVSAAVDSLGEGVDAAADGNVLSLASRVITGIGDIVHALGLYEQEFAKLKGKTERYKSAVEEKMLAADDLPVKSVPPEGPPKPTEAPPELPPSFKGMPGSPYE